jgi:hypothetical protein
VQRLVFGTRVNRLATCGLASSTCVSALRHSLHFLFGIDTRSLGLFRIAFASVLIYDLLLRWRVLDAFYSNAGVLPNGILYLQFSGQPHFCPLALVQTLPSLHIVFALGLAAYVAFLIGWFTRAFSLLSFFFFVNLVNRNPLTNFGGDVVMVTIFAWALLLPLGTRFSIDRIRRARCTVIHDQVYSLAAFGIVLQIALIYGLAGFNKRDSWWDGTAVFDALHLDQYASALGVWLRSCPLIVLKALCYFTLAVELMAPLLILSPFAQPLLRRICIVGLLVLQCGIWATMELSTFPATMLALLPLLLTSADWQVLHPRPQGHEGSPTPTRRADRNEPSLVKVGRVIACQALAVVLLLAVLWSSYARNIKKTNDRSLPYPLFVLISSLQMSQGWHLFAPYPQRTERWCVPVGVTDTGARVNLATGDPFDWTTDGMRSWRKDRFWKVYSARLIEAKARRLLPYCAQSLYDARGHGGAAIRTIEFYECMELSPAPGQSGERGRISKMLEYKPRR